MTVGVGGTTPGPGGALAARLVPDELWAVARPLLPSTRPRSQGGGRRRADDRAVLTAVVFVLTGGGPWRSIPDVFGVAVPTAYRRFCEWTAHDIWTQLADAVRRDGCRQETVAWAVEVVRAARIRSRTRQGPT